MDKFDWALVSCRMLFEILNIVSLPRLKIHSRSLRIESLDLPKSQESRFFQRRRSQNSDSHFALKDFIFDKKRTKKNTILPSHSHNAKSHFFFFPVFLFFCKSLL